MKTKLFSLMSATVLIFAVAVTKTSIQASDGMMDGLLLENIEALSQGEGSTVCTYQKVSIDEKKHTLKCSGHGSQCCIMN